MVPLTRLDGSQLVLNDDQILFVEAQHDTVVTLANGEKLRVLESPDELVRRIASWRRRVLGLSLVSADEIEREESE